MQLQLLHHITQHYTTQHYTTQHYTNYITLRYIYNCICNYNYHYIALCYTTLSAIHYNYNYTTLHSTTLGYTTLDHTTVHNATVHYNTLQFITLKTPHHNCNWNFNWNYTNYITLELQLTTTTPLRCIQQLWWGDHCKQRNHSKKNTTPTTCRSISGFALPSVIHNNQPLLQVSYFWNFRHPLCGTTGMILSIWIQNSRFTAQEKLLQSNLFGFKIRIQDVFLGSWILNPIPWDSRSCFGILNLEAWTLPP